MPNPDKMPMNIRAIRMMPMEASIGGREEKETCGHGLSRERERESWKVNMVVK